MHALGLIKLGRSVTALIEGNCGILPYAYLQSALSIRWQPTAIGRSSIPVPTSSHTQQSNLSATRHSGARSLSAMGQRSLVWWWKVPRPYFTLPTPNFSLRVPLPWPSALRRLRAVGPLRGPPSRHPWLDCGCHPGTTAIMAVGVLAHRLLVFWRGDVLPDGSCRQRGLLGSAATGTKVARATLQVAAGLLSYSANSKLWRKCSARWLLLWKMALDVPPRRQRGLQGLRQ